MKLEITIVQDEEDLENDFRGCDFKEEDLLHWRKDSVSLLLVIQEGMLNMQSYERS